MSDWQPIETAPKDGTQILCWRNGRIDQASWRKDWMGDWGWGGIAWTYPDSNLPTHWMPLPEPPEGHEGE